MGLKAIGGISGGGNSNSNGTVTSVGLEAPSSFTVSNSPVTSVGNITVAWNLSANGVLTANGNGPIGQIPFVSNANRFLDGTGNFTIPAGTATGTVTSVSVIMPSGSGGFTVSGSPITTAGNITVLWNQPANSILVGNSNGPLANIAFTNNANQVLLGTGAFGPPPGGAGGTTLNGITAATASQAGISNADFNIRWNWQKTTNSETAFEFGESAASTNGTSTSGVPNQVLLKLSTVASSTMSPLSVYSRGSHVFSVSPSARQLLAYDGTTTNPAYSFTSGTNYGLHKPGTGLSLVVNGVERLIVDPNGTYIGTAGTGIAPSLANLSTQWGFFFPTGALAISEGGAGEGARFSSGVFQPSKGSADAVAYAINARKSRGTVASPTAITTGDDLLTISGYGYVGGTGTYVEAANITFDSTGTIANNSTGVGGVIRFNVAKVGAAPAEVMRLTAGTTTGGGWLTMNEADASPGTGDLTADDEGAFYVKNGNAVFAQNVGGSMKFLYCPIDGSTTTWTANGTGP